MTAMCSEVSRSKKSDVVSTTKRKRRGNFLIFVLLIVERCFDMIEVLFS